MRSPCIICKYEGDRSLCCETCKLLKEYQLHITAKINDGKYPYRPGNEIYVEIETKILTLQGNNSCKKE